MIDWTDPLPYVFSPKSIALLWSFKAPATISDAEAEPLFIKMISGFPFNLSPFFAKKRLFSLAFLPFVETISPSFKKKSVTFIAWVNNPPGLFLRSSITPVISAPISS